MAGALSISAQLSRTSTDMTGAWSSGPRTFGGGTEAGRSTTVWRPQNLDQGAGLRVCYVTWDTGLSSLDLFPHLGPEARPCRVHHTMIEGG